MKKVKLLKTRDGVSEVVDMDFELYLTLKKLDGLATAFFVLFSDNKLTPDLGCYFDEESNRCHKLLNDSGMCKHDKRASYELIMTNSDDVINRFENALEILNNPIDNDLPL
ncbi:MAG: hypothetical protein LDL23_06985 [Flavobacterium sp.]|uniref:hypothetical protein n=1 Tax=Flavobacterium sp. TaxID=239 RepID=UPI0025BB7CC1|nr:hypothetical protein [Flavobacterium sp.]MCA1966380.1 hypothetical protein [Flavobacterium sp.]